MEADDLDRFADQTRRTTCRDPFHPTIMIGAKTFGNDEGNVFAARFLEGMAEHLCGGGIPEGDQPGLSRGDDGHPARPRKAAHRVLKPQITAIVELAGNQARQPAQQIELRQGDVVARALIDHAKRAECHTHVVDDRRTSVEANAGRTDDQRVGGKAVVQCGIRHQERRSRGDRIVTE